MRLKAYSVLVVFVIGSLLAGCVTQQQINSAPQQQSRNVILVQSKPSGSVHLVNKITVAGQTIPVTGGLLVNPDCTSRGLATLKVIQPPVHGTVKIAKRDEYPSFPQQNPRSVCNTHKLPGVYADYTPDDGFTGADFMTVETFMRGVEIDERISITVK